MNNNNIINIYNLVWCRCLELIIINTRLVILIYVSLFEHRSPGALERLWHCTVKPVVESELSV